VTGVLTPSGYLRGADLNRMIDDLGGFGPSRIDTERLGAMTSDILLAATKRTTRNVRKDVAMGRPWAHGIAQSIEEGFRRGVFVDALQKGETPEAAMTLARRSQFDYGQQDVEIVRALGPYWAGAVSTAAAGAEFIERVARDPRNYSRYLRALREQQRANDPTGEQGDTPLRTLFVPMTDEVAEDLFGRALDVLGPSAPYLAPVDAVVGLAQAVAGVEGATKIMSEAGARGLAAAALNGGVEAMEAFAERMALASAGLSGQPPSEAAATRRRALGPASIDTTYLATLALARSLDPDGFWHNVMFSVLRPEFQRPPTELGSKDDPLRWFALPSKDPPAGAFVYEATDVPGTYYVVRPSKVGRQNLRTLSSIPVVGPVVNRIITTTGIGMEEGVGEGILWGIGAETVEEPTARAVEQVRPTTGPL